jgi:40S ribosomal protein S4 C-terminus
VERWRLVSARARSHAALGILHYVRRSRPVLARPGTVQKGRRQQHLGGEPLRARGLVGCPTSHHQASHACLTAAARVQVHDSVMLELESGKVKDFIKFEVGNLVMCTGGANCGRVGIVQHREKHKGAVEMVHVIDAAGRRFVTRITNVFVIGKGTKPLVSLPKGKGVRKTIIEAQATILPQD